MHREMSAIKSIFFEIKFIRDVNNIDDFLRSCEDQKLKAMHRFFFNFFHFVFFIRLPSRSMLLCQH